ncbi:MAG: zinc-binding dehydrogenase [Rhodospirillaceae bacterium]|jgi:threonine dehydrogenase-like Zn-dependent dehydrogenase|nr:zinc-binding dehydrogenase [Rhodospirillaceae bacterium]MBT4689391.1 zinc-binding dehydrogenase [Rhodospirillaceae bacterium]MBT5081026.1 zinc-binding dehydrogenase [Rhodospirillaceae bacterium]MBT5526169.1 zinc-binding dehydrogenase [Rhodospirillaceae bacterium]MBT5879697.1 zinc-binding dehydrogenase [Rhodospirillaceae bacterium]
MQGWSYVYTGANEPFEIREFPVPEVDADGILVRVTVSSICGSDLHGWHGDTPRAPITIMGHEMTGVVERLGSNIHTDAAGQALREGDRIVYSYFYPCHHCQPCLSNDSHHCDSRRIGAGRSKSDKPPHFTGAYAEYFYLRPGHFILRTPDALSDRVTAPLNCALAQVTYGLDQVNLRAGETVVIQGAGGLGLYAAAVAREAGATNIIVLDKLPDRLALAREFGADHVLNVDDFDSPEQRIEAVKDLTGGGGHVVAELVGHPAALTEGLQMARNEGRYLVIGNISGKHTIPFNPAWLVHSNRRMVGVGGYQAWALRRGLELLHRGADRYPFEKILSELYPIDQINTAFAEADKGAAIRTGLICDPKLARI